ncbi:periplasmic binding protein-like I [Zopfochytrium polystomum]|nr:periplasmic binding protein-like I [Zopfochytrium polystomum]
MPDFTISGGTLSCYGFDNDGAVVPPSRTSANVTIVFTAPYLFMDDMKPVNFTYPDVYSSILHGLDAAAQMAIDEINKRAEILPGVCVKVLRVNVESEKPEGFITETEENGAIGAVALESLLKNTRPLGIVNMSTGWASRIFAQFVANTNTPMCTANTGQSPEMTVGDFCRTCFSSQPDVKSLSTAVVAYLEATRVRRVAILYERRFYKSAREHLLVLLSQSNIRIVAYVPVSSEDREALATIYRYLVSVDARYIVCIMNPSTVAEIYFRSREFQLVSPKHVWLTLTPPLLNGMDLTTVYGDNAAADLEGLVFLHHEAQPRSAASVAQFNSEYSTRSQLDPSWYVTSGGDPPVFASSSFDCVNMMLGGYDRFLRQTHGSLQDLVDGRLQWTDRTQMFSGIDYKGVSQERMILDSNGFSLQSVVFVNLNMTNMFENPDRDRGFGEVSFEPGSPFMQYRPQIFYGGSTIPPPDGTVHLIWFLNSPSSVHGILSIIAATVGVAACALSAAMAIRFRRDRIFVSTSALFAVVQAAGLGLVTASGLFSALTFTPLKCKARLWFQLGGFSLLMASALVKNTKVYFLLNPERRFKMNSTLEAALFGTIVLIEAALLLGWSFAQDARPAMLETLESVVEICLSSPISQFPGKTLLYVYNCLLLMGAFQATRTARWNERRYTDSSIDNAMTLWSLTVATAAGCLALPVIETAEPGPAGDTLRYFAAWTASAFAIIALFGSKASTLRAKYIERASPLHGSLSLRFLNQSVHRANSKECIAAADSKPSGNIAKRSSPVLAKDLGKVCFQTNLALWPGKWSTATATLLLGQPRLLILNSSTTSCAFVLDETSTKPLLPSGGNRVAVAVCARQWWRWWPCASWFRRRRSANTEVQSSSAPSSSLPTGGGQQPDPERANCVSNSVRPVLLLECEGPAEAQTLVRAFDPDSDPSPAGEREGVL